jgi:hypothetical protein
MELLLLLGAVAFAGVLLLCGVVAVVVHAVVWLILLPFRLLAPVLFLPFWLAGVLLKGLFALVIVPVVLIAALVAGGAVLALGVATLLAPLLLVVLVVMIVKALTAASVAAAA